MRTSFCRNSRLGECGSRGAQKEIFVHQCLALVDLSSGACSPWHFPVIYLLPDGFFPLEFWRHWFKRVIQWRIRVYFILKDHVISSSVLKPVR